MALLPRRNEHNAVVKEADYLERLKKLNNKLNDVEKKDEK